jgi:integrase
MVNLNAAEDVDRPQLKKEEIRPLDREQARRLLAVARYRLHAFYVVAVTAGLRPSELLALRWKDVDLEASTLRINRALSQGEFSTPQDTPQSAQGRAFEYARAASRRTVSASWRSGCREWRSGKSRTWCSRAPSARPFLTATLCVLSRRC